MPRVVDFCELKVPMYFANFTPFINSSYKKLYYLLYN